MTSAIFLPLLFAACGPPEPVLPGVLRPQAEERGERAIESYERPDGVYVDVRYLAGESLDKVRDQVAIQLGDVQEIRPLDPRDGEEMILERGHLRLKEGVIYRVDVELPEPVPRSEALAMLGLPIQADRWYGTHREWLLRWTWGFSKIRMVREEGAASPESVVLVELTRWDPRKDRRR